MKKILSLAMIFIFVISTFSIVLAADEYSFKLQYTGEVVKNVEKNANVLLIGVNGTLHTNVRIKVDIGGPATPRLLATDSNGTELDIAQIGYWGPDVGFAVQGDFTNTTPIKATFPEEGNYTITLSLIDVANANAVITTKTIAIQVYEDAPSDENNVIDNNIVDNNVVNNTIEELPKLGTSVVEYAMYVIAIVLVLSIIGIYINKKRIDA